MHLFYYVLFLTFGYSINAAKIGVFLSTLSKSQILFGYQLADALNSDGHEIVIIRPDINPYIHEFKPGKFRDITLDTLKPFGYEIFDNFSITRDEISFSDVNFLSKEYYKLGAEFKTLIDMSCLEIISNKDFLNALKAENFDFLYLNHHLNCAMAVAYKLKIRYALFTSCSMSRSLTIPFGVPWISSVNPAWLSHNTDEMSWFERANNLYHTVFELIQNFALSGFNSMYREHFGDDFPDARELAKNAELAFVNDEELFEFPQPISHKIVFIGGVDEFDKPQNELNQDYQKFIDNKKTILVSLGSVANSTQMPKSWKAEFKRLFELNPQIQFIWKYDGTDVETPSNVLVSKWIPQVDLLKSGKISIFLSHCGYNSLSESLYAGVPMLLVPLFADQPRNANLAKKRGVALVVEKSNLSADAMSEQIDKILNDPSFHKNSQKFQHLLKNKPFKPRELVRRWNKFLLENEPVDLNIKTLNIIQYYCLDILIPFLLVSVTITAWILIRLGRLYYWSCFGMGKKSAHLKRE